MIYFTDRSTEETKPKVDQSFVLFFGQNRLGPTYLSGLEINKTNALDTGEVLIRQFSVTVIA